MAGQHDGVCIAALDPEVQQVIGNAFDEVFVTDSRGIVQFVSAPCERLYGCPAEYLMGRSVTELVSAGFFKPSATIMALRERRSIVTLQTTRQGRRLIVIANPVYDGEGKIRRVISASKDITELNSIPGGTVPGERKPPEENCDNDPLLVACSPRMRAVLDMVDRVAQYDVAVLITGESGVGKDLLARRIHRRSPRAGGPFVKINCGAIPDSLVETELFGYESGAFTGARREGKKGMVELANGGTLFLDEIGDLPLPAQVKLLHLLSDRAFQRVGGTRRISVDVRIIAATNRDLLSDVRSGRFREDLFYRINVVSIHVPPLRERPEDKEVLLDLLIARLSRKHGVQRRFTKEAREMLLSYSWPGNVREMENVIEHLVLCAAGEEITAEDVRQRVPIEDTRHALASSTVSLPPLREALRQTEEQLLRAAMCQYRSIREVARVLGVDHSTVVRKLRRLGLTR